MEAHAPKTQKKVQKKSNAKINKAAKSKNKNNIRASISRLYSPPSHISPNIQLSPENLEYLQKTVGNQAVSRMIQAKLKVGEPDDKHELEAEQVADSVMRTPPPTPVAEEEPIQTQPLANKITPNIQKQTEEDEVSRQPLEEKDHLVQENGETGSNNEISPQLSSTISEMQGGGEPLSESSRAYFESQYGKDFSQVRVHSGAKASDAASKLNAQAFTHGKDIFMGANKYQPETDQGKRLLAHELTHVVQQNPMGNANLQRQPAEPAGTAENAPAEAVPTIAPGVEEIKGKRSYKPADAAAQWLEEQEDKQGKVKVRFGKIAQGIVEMQKAGENFGLTRKQNIALSYPVFQSLSEELKPSLVLDKGAEVKGYIALWSGKGMPSRNALQKALKDAPSLIGLNGFDFDRLPRLTNSIEAGNLRLGLKGVKITLGSAFTGSISLEADDQKITSFEGNAKADVQGLASGNLDLKRSETGLITGKATLDLKLPKNFSGGLDVAWDGRAITGEGKVGYQGEKLSGEIILKIMERSQAEKLEADKKVEAEGEKKAAPERKKARSKKSDKVNYAVFGEGDLTFSFTEWLSGTAHVIVDSRGFVTIIGKITPQKEFELFPQKDYNKKLFKVEARATYGIPVVGNIFIFANIGMDAFAKLGPAKFYSIEIGGTYSTDPDKCKDFSIKGSLNISAAAGLRLRGEAGAGLEILAHDIKAGAGINAIAGIRGYAEATPTIGYREKQAKKGEDKKGEFFIRGDMEIAAQPFLGLNGDLFVEIDAPWWSPVPDKRWTWPLGGKEWPIGGTFGLGASIDYVFGSGQVPAIEFKPVEFDSSKFMTDLYSDKAKTKSGKKDDKPGKWKEKNTKEAAPPSKKVKKTDAKVGKPPKLPKAKSKVKPGGPKKPVKQANPKAKTAEGKTVKEYQDEAARRGRKPAGKEPMKGTGKDTQLPSDDSRKKPDKLDEKESARVKTDALNDLKSAIKKRKFKSVGELDELTRQVYQRHKPKGLKYLRSEVKGKGLDYDIHFKAAASPDKDLILDLDDIIKIDLNKELDDDELLKVKQQLSVAGRNTFAVLTLNDKIEGTEKDEESGKKQIGSKSGRLTRYEKDWIMKKFQVADNQKDIEEAIRKWRTDLKVLTNEEIEAKIKTPHAEEKLVNSPIWGSATEKAAKRTNDSLTKNQKSGADLNIEEKFILAINRTACGRCAKIVGKKLSDFRDKVVKKLKVFKSKPKFKNIFIFIFSSLGLYKGTEEANLKHLRDNGWDLKVHKPSSETKNVTKLDEKGLTQAGKRLYELLLKIKKSTHSGNKGKK
jgi:hypothetical protein